MIQSLATEVAKFFFSGYSPNADMFGGYTVRGAIIIMSALASLTPIVMYYFTIRKWGAAAQIKFGAIYYTITLVCPVLLVLAFEFDVELIAPLLFHLTIIIGLHIEFWIIATPIISILVVLACHYFGTFCKMEA